MFEEQPPGGSVPYAAFAGAPLSPRPTSVTVVAVLAIVFGSMGLLAVLCSVPGIILNHGGAGAFGGFTPTYTATSSSTTNTATGATTFNYHTSSPAFPAYTREPVFVVYQVVNTLLWLILATIALWAGIGLLRLSPVARIWIMRYAVADIVVGALGLIFTILVLQPKMIAAMQSMQQNNAPPGVNMGAFMTIGLYVGDFFNLALLSWPAVVLYIMTRPHVKAVFGVSKSPL